jgi:hypothetical protein
LRVASITNLKTPGVTIAVDLARIDQYRGVLDAPAFKAPHLETRA